MDSWIHGFIDCIEFIESIGGKMFDNPLFFLQMAVQRQIPLFVKSQLEHIKWKLGEKKLLELINAPDEKGSTLLCDAKELGSEDIVEQLLAAGANPFYTDINGITAKMAAIDRGDSYNANRLEKLEIEHNKTASEQDLRYQNFMNNATIIKRYGHSLGISSDITIDGPTVGSTAEIRTDASYSLVSISQLNNELELYKKSITVPKLQKKWDEIFEAFKFEERYLRFSEGEKAVTAENLLKRAMGELEPEKLVEPPKLTTIPCGWLEHDFAIAIYKDYFIVCNRGQGLHPDRKGTHIYKLTDEAKKILKEQGYIESLRPKGDRLPMVDIMSRLNRVVDASNVVAALPSKAQKHGTCSFVNAKALCEGILFVQNLEEGRTLGQMESQTEIQNAMKAARIEYKKFTQYLRDSEIDRIIAEMKANENKTSVIKVYDGIIEAYLKQHFIKTNQSDEKKEKRIIELNRAKKLLSAMGDRIKNGILERLEKNGVDLIVLAEKYKVNDLLDLLNGVKQDQLKKKIEWVQQEAEKLEKQKSSTSENQAEPMTIEYKQMERKIESMDKINNKTAGPITVGTKPKDKNKPHSPPT